LGFTLAQAALESTFLRRVTLDNGVERRTFDL
jgi:hypothetical protein